MTIDSMAFLGFS